MHCFAVLALWAHAAHTVTIYTRTKEAFSTYYALQAPLVVNNTGSVTTIPATQTACPTEEPATIGTIHVELNATIHVTDAPVSTISQVDNPQLLPKIITTATPGFPKPTTTAANNLFRAFTAGRPPSQFQSGSDHPVQKKAFLQNGKPMHTNKFYTNFFVGSQKSGVWTHPYSLTYHDCKTNTLAFCGMSISHIERSKLAVGPGNPAKYFINPIGIQSVILSAVELGPSTSMTISNAGPFSVNVLFASASGATPKMTIPVVQGMGFISAVYSNAQPVLQSGVFFLDLVLVSAQPVNAFNVFKYRATLMDGRKWLIYVRSSNTKVIVPLELVSASLIRGPKSFTGTIQVAKAPATAQEISYDRSAGTYATGAVVSASPSGSSAKYSISWNKAGVSGQRLLMFALPHHVQAFDTSTRNSMTGIQLQTTTKGLATAIYNDNMTMVESDLPRDWAFSPVKDNGQSAVLSNAAAQAIRNAATKELGQDIMKQADLPSMYWAGKALAKFAMIIYAAHEHGRAPEIALVGLVELKDALAMFIDNRQQFPWYYDTVWGGLVSSASYGRNDPGIDYGNTYYNDHHFHYGYFVYTAAVIGYFDPAWIQKGSNKAWVESLIRDYANPIETDAHFPFSRSFDWFNGHSWADGLFESADGKNEESSSEDVFSIYAVKMWAKVRGDVTMEERSNLQLAVLKRSLRNYFLYESDNMIQPSSFIGNKVSGILFENKIDHTTYFGNNIEYIQGIHMIPLHPMSSYTRTKRFVSEEWNTYFSNGRITSVEPAWRNILTANLALIDAQTSWNYFADPKFDLSKLDSGASLTWYLTFAAALGGSPP